MKNYIKYLFVLINTNKYIFYHNIKKDNFKQTNKIYKKKQVLYNEFTKFL